MLLQERQSGRSADDERWVNGGERVPVHQGSHRHRLFGVLTGKPISGNGGQANIEKLNGLQNLEIRRNVQISRFCRPMIEKSKMKVR
jgi:hypothetical protein